MNLGCPQAPHTQTQRFGLRVLFSQVVTLNTVCTQQTPGELKKAQVTHFGPAPEILMYLVLDAAGAENSGSRWGSLVSGVKRETRLQLQCSLVVSDSCLRRLGAFLSPWEGGPVWPGLALPPSHSVSHQL